MKNEYINNKKFEEIIENFRSSSRSKRRCEFILEDLRETHGRRLEKYSDNVRKGGVTLQEKRYSEVCTNFKKLQEQLSFAFYVLSENVAGFSRFQGIDLDDAIQEGVLICFDKLDRFDASKGKAFNYLTTCILNHYRQIYRSIRSYNEFKKRYHVFLHNKFEKVFLLQTNKVFFDAGDTNTDRG
jgi:hypothetical protein